ncbi:MAG: hypothetical protein ACOY45_05265 [Pseudomonadota bacterium]
MALWWALAILAVSGAAAPRDNAKTTPPTPPMPDLPACSRGASWQMVARKADLPPDVLAVLDTSFAQTHGIAEAGSDFEAGDSIVTDFPQARFLRAYRIGNQWFIWFERGGAGLSRYLLGIGDVPAGSGRHETGVLPGSHFTGDLCAGMRACLAGARSAG